MGVGCEAEEIAFDKRGWRAWNFCDAGMRKMRGLGLVGDKSGSDGDKGLAGNGKGRLIAKLVHIYHHHAVPASEKITLLLVTTIQSAVRYNAPRPIRPCILY